MIDVLDNSIIDTVSETEKTEEANFQLATISEVSESGITLALDGADSAGEKLYKCNPDVLFKAGDRVKITKDSGTYIVDSVVGTPMARYPIPSGGTAGNLLSRGTDEYSVIWVSEDSYIKLPSGGASNKVLGYDASNGVAWVQGIPTTGTTGYYLQKTITGVQWAEAASFPTTGTANQFLQKTSTGTQWATVTQYSGPTINGSGTTTLGFYGTTAGTRQSLSTTYNNQGYTSATSSNYLYILNNIAGILKKLGLINQY